jgi:alpha-tubulin suppressor-like RCC1 family protein
MRDGTVRSWGNNSCGELGNGSRSGAEDTPEEKPATVFGLTGVVAVAVGGVPVTSVFYIGGGGQVTTPPPPPPVAHSLALEKDGSVWAWGSNKSGQLGAGSSTDAVVPARVPGLSEPVRAISAGNAFSLALTADGAVYAWGDNTYGQLGIRPGKRSAGPVRVGGLPAVAAIAAGDVYCLAVGRDGSVWAWGLDCGRLGDGLITEQSSDPVNRSVPVRVKKLSDVVDVAAGENHGMALRRDGTIWVWGDNDRGQLGFVRAGIAPNTRYVPVRLPALTDVVAIAACGNGSAALRRDGAVWSWGAHAPDAPTPVNGAKDVTSVALGYSYGSGFAVRRDGTVARFGRRD